MRGDCRLLGPIRYRYRLGDGCLGGAHLVDCRRVGENKNGAGPARSYAFQTRTKRTKDQKTKVPERGTELAVSCSGR